MFTPRDPLILTAVFFAGVDMARFTVRIGLWLLSLGLGANVYAADALLPMLDTVAPTQAQPIDGMWTVSTLGKRVRIEKGRVYVVDGWRHLFVLTVRPGMVVVKDIQAQGAGTFAGYDLMAIGPWRAKKNASGNLDVELGGLVPSRFQMLPVQLDNPAAYQQVPVAVAPNPYAVAPAPVAAPAPGGPIVPALPDSSYPTLPNAQTPVQPVVEQPAAGPPTPVPGAAAGGTTCREVIYQAETDNFKCVQ